MVEEKTAVDGNTGGTWVGTEGSGALHTWSPPFGARVGRERRYLAVLPGILRVFWGGGGKRCCDPVRTLEGKPLWGHTWILKSKKWSVESAVKWEKMELVVGPSFWAGGIIREPENGSTRQKKGTRFDEKLNNLKPDGALLAVERRKWGCAWAATEVVRRGFGVRGKGEG